jgi:hypothetical protein
MLVGNNNEVLVASRSNPDLSKGRVPPSLYQLCEDAICKGLAANSPILLNSVKHLPEVVAEGILNKLRNSYLLSDKLFGCCFANVSSQLTKIDLTKYFFFSFLGLFFFLLNINQILLLLF